MAIFYVLPTRPALGEAVAQMLRPFVPGAEIDRNDCADLVDSLVSNAPSAGGNFVVHREDLPDGEDMNAVLRDGFGAESGDEVVLVSFGPRPEAPRVRRYQLEAA